MLFQDEEELKCYINGLNIGSTTGETRPPRENGQPSFIEGQGEPDKHSFTIGKNSNIDSSSNLINPSIHIDDVYLWHIVLEEDEIQLLHEDGFQD